MTDIERNFESESEEKGSGSETNEGSGSGSGSEANDESGPGTDSDSGSDSEGSEQKLNKYIRNTLEHEIVLDSVWHVLKMYVIVICVLYIYLIIFGK
jgi:hypothetical protein